MGKRELVSAVLRRVLIYGGILALLWALLEPTLYARNPEHIRRAKESTLRANVQLIRRAIGCFHQDTSVYFSIGVYPATLADLYAPNEHALTKKVQPGSYQGPYLADVFMPIAGTELPRNPFVKPGDNIVSHHWRYDANEGVVTSAVEGTTTEGESYSSF